MRASIARPAWNVNSRSTKGPTMSVFDVLILIILVLLVVLLARRV
jgi:hypothetical protein